MVSPFFQPCRRATGKELLAFCRVSLMLSATLRPGGVLRGGALYAAAVQPNREPALYWLALGHLAEAPMDPPRAPAAQCRSGPLPRAVGTVDRSKRQHTNTKS